MKTLIVLLAAVLILAFGFYLGVLYDRMWEQEPSDLSNGQDDPGYLLGDPRDDDDFGGEHD